MVAWALERRHRQVTDHVAKEHPSLAKGREHARNVEVRADYYLCRGVLRTNIREQEQRQEPAAPTVHIYPPLAAIHLVAAVNVPASVPRILHAGETQRNASSHVLPPNPTVWSEKRVVHLLERRRRTRRGERGTLGARETDDGRSPRRGISRFDISRAQLLLDNLNTLAHDAGRYDIAYHQKSICGEVVSGYRHASLPQRPTSPPIRGEPHAISANAYPFGRRNEDCSGSKTSGAYSSASGRFCCRSRR